MAIQQIKNSLLYALSTDTKPTTYADNTILYEQDTGNVFRSVGGSWSLFSGASKTETLSNKTMSYTNSNTITPDLKNLLTRRSPDLGSWGAHHADASATYTPYGHEIVRATLTPAVTLVTTVRTTEGIVVNQASGTVANTLTGWYNNTGFHWTCPDANPDLKVRCRFNQTAAMRVIIGFTSVNTTAPTSDTLLAATGFGVFLGFRTTDTNMQLVTVNGTTATYKDTGQALTTSGFHTWEVKLSSGTASALYDGTLLTTTTTTIPANGNLFSPLVQISNSTTTSVNWDLHWDVYRADF